MKLTRAFDSEERALFQKMSSFTKKKPFQIVSANMHRFIHQVIMEFCKIQSTVLIEIRFYWHECKTL